MHCKDTILRTQNNWPYSKLIPNSGNYGYSNPVALQWFPLFQALLQNISINLWNTFFHVRFNRFVVLEKEPYNSAETTAQFSCNERIMKP